MTINELKCLYDSIDQSRYSVQYENYPVLEEDHERERIYDYKEVTIKFHGSTAKANTNFYI